MSDEHLEDASAGVITPTQKLRSKLSAFRFDEELTPSLRRSERNRARLVKFEEGESSLPTLASDVASPTPRKQSRTPEASDVDTKSSSRKRRRADSVPRRKAKKKPEIAAPEKYAHLNPLSDHLGDEADILDVMFCGINPGQLSATIGHHFAHPTNHFWRCLHGSQLTDRLLNATEDHILPYSYRLGLTNLAERPSARASEIANSEFTAGVPKLMHKITQKRPRIVCFVGKGIWDSFIRAAAPPLVSSSPPVKSEAPPEALATSRTQFTFEVATSVDAVELKSSEPSSSPTVTSTSTTTGAATTKVANRPKAKRATSTKPHPSPFVYDLQPYKIIHSTPAGAATTETLFFVVVSTSGLVASHQLPEKIKQFTILKQRVDEFKRGTLDTSSMTVIPVPTAPMA